LAALALGALSAEPAALAQETGNPEILTPQAMTDLAGEIDALARARFSGSGGRLTADTRLATSTQLSDLANRLRDAGASLEAAIDANAASAGTLQTAREAAFSTTAASATAIRGTGNAELAQALSNLLLPEPPEPEAPPEPVTYRFCLQAGGIGPRTYEANVPDVIDAQLIGAPGHIANSVRRVDANTTYFMLTVEEGSEVNMMQIINAMQDVADAAAQKMDPPRLASTTILVGDLGDDMCGQTSPDGFVYGD